MKIMLVQLALIIFVTSTTFAANYQGEVTKISANQLTIEIFGDEFSGIKNGTQMVLKLIPENVPTLDMLQG